MRTVVVKHGNMSGLKKKVSHKLNHASRMFCRLGERWKKAAFGLGES